MTRRKWYVVTVGRDIGVFPTWLEVGPLVKGLPNALHQSFPTEEEARRIFARERARGNTKIVDSNHQRAYSTPPNSFHRSESFSRSSNIYRSQTESSIIINPQSALHPPRTYVQTHSTKNPTPSTGVLPGPSRPLSPIPSSTSELSPSIRRFEIIDALFNKGSPNIGVEARASSSSAQSSTPIRHTTSLGSPRLSNPPSPHSRAVVKTPSWLASYPKAVESPLQPLSPLSSVDLPLHHFRFEEWYEEKSSPRNRHITSASYSQSSVRNYYGHDVDPRSPLLDKAGGKIPELSSVNSFPFARPSPSTRAEYLHMESCNMPMKASLLLKPSLPLEL